MPYGVSKRAGGDSPENVAKMERCVSKLKAKGHSESSAIAICKDSLFKGGKGGRRASRS